MQICGHGAAKLDHLFVGVVVLPYVCHVTDELDVAFDVALPKVDAVEDSALGVARVSVSIVLGTCFGQHHLPACVGANTQLRFPQFPQIFQA